MLIKHTMLKQNWECDQQRNKDDKFTDSGELLKSYSNYLNCSNKVTKSAKAQIPLRRLSQKLPCEESREHRS